MIFLTGRSAHEFEEYVGTHVRIMTKPFDPTELVQVVREAMGEGDDRGTPGDAPRGGDREGGADARRETPLPIPERSDPAEGFGDFTTNVAMVIASHARSRSAGDGCPRSWRRSHPRRSSRRRRWRGPASSTWRPPTTGSTTWFEASSRRADATGRAPTGRRIQVEFVSANPTGPLTIGHAERRDRGRARPAAHVRRPRGGARILLQRRRRADGSLRARPSRHGTSRRSVATPRCPRTGITGSTSRTSRARSWHRRAPAWRTCRRRSGSSGSARKQPASRWSRSGPHSHGSA